MNFTIIDIVNGGASQEKEKSLRDSHRKRKLINENRVEEVQTTLHHRTRYSLTEKKFQFAVGIRDKALSSFTTSSRVGKLCMSM